MRTPPLLSPSRTPSIDPAAAAPSALGTWAQRKSTPVPKVLSDHPIPKQQRPSLSHSQDSNKDSTIESHGVRDRNGFKLSTAVMEKSKAKDGDLFKVDRTRRHMTAQMAVAQKRDGPAREINTELPDSPRTSATEKFATILEEASPSLSPRQEGMIGSPLLTGSQTTSTESANTVRGGPTPQIPGANPVSTPAYPFPPMSSRSMSPTNATTPAFHKPFTALSPTIIPPSAKSSKPQASRDRLASGQATPSSMAAFMRLSGPDLQGTAQGSGPDLYELSLILQSEPGLDSWWANVGRIMRDHFGTERASLAVPSDSTDLENVPWAQLATYNGGDEDPLSRATNQRQSTQSSLNDLSSQEDARSETGGGVREINAEKGGVNWTDTAPATQSRPTLESRHSFSGFARKVEPSTIELKMQVSTVGPRRPGTLRTTSSMALHAERSLEGDEKSKGVRLSTESLENYLALEASRSPQSVNFSDVAERGPRGRVFPVMQTLELEADPLLNSAGAVRVLERGKVVHITREYLDETQSGSQKIVNQEDALLHSKISWPTPNSKTTELKVVEPPEASLRTPPLWNVIASPSLQKRRSHTSESSHSSSYLRGGRDDTLQKGLHLLAYEDYEQVPASPWSQSPAPSPAVQADPNVNPFFADVSIDEDAFAENPPAHDYSEDRQVEAIGIDRASSIVHVPLIHPVLSKPKRPPRFGTEGGKGKHRKLGDEVLPSISKSSIQASLANSETDKRTPIAILSILSTHVPYPSILSSSLRDLAPHLATSFYTAQQHSNLEKAVAGHSRRRYSPNDGFTLLDSRGIQHVPTSNGLAIVGKLEDGFSPPNTGSVTSASEYSSRSRYSPRGSVAGTPSWEPTGHGSQDEQRIAGTPGYDAGQEANDSYFHITRRQIVNRTDSAPLPTLASMNSRFPRGFPSSSNKEPMQGPPSASAQRPVITRESRPVLSEFTEVTNVPNVPNTKSAPLAKIDESQGPPRGSNEHDTLNVDPRRARGVSPPQRHGDQQGSPRKQASQQTLGQGQELSIRIHKHSHTHGGDFEATNPSLPATTAQKPSRPLPSGGTGAVEPSFAFRPPTSKLMRIMIDTGATQEFIADPTTGHITWANSKFLTYRNESEAEIGRKPWDTIHPKDQKTFRKLWTNALHAGDQVSHQVRLRRFDSQYRWFHIRIVPIKDKYGIITQWHGQAMDIHEQHIAEVDAAREKEKAASESKYRSLANSNPHIIFAASVPGGMTFANTQWLSYSGQDLDQALSFGFLDHVHPHDVLKCRFPAFSSHSASPNLSATPATRGQLLRTDSALSTAEVSDSTTVTDETLRANDPESPDLGGAADTEAPTGMLEELIKDGVIKASKDGQGRPSIATEMRLRSKTGEYRWHLVQGSLIESVNFGQGDAQWIIACADISDQKHDEEQLKKANATLEQETTRKMQFLSTMSHEIRTPLNGVIGNLQFLLNSELNEYQSEWTFGAVAAAKGMHDLINDILDVSKAEAKMLKLYFDWFHIRSIIEDVFETLSSKADEKRLDLCYAVNEDVPSQIKGDGGRIRQVLLNLVGNAIKFTQKGEIFVECKVPKGPVHGTLPRLGKHDILLLFNVVDTGSGFTEEEAKRLFQPYSQIDNSSTRSNGGTGLGLLLCKQMVELHGGNISATSIPEKGSIFTFFARFRLPTPTDHPNVEKSALSRTNSSISSAAEPPQKTAYAAGHHSIFQPSLGESPSPVVVAAESEVGQESPAKQSSGSSNRSVDSVLLRPSTTSSASSIEKDDTAAAIELALPMDALGTAGDVHEPRSLKSIGPVKVPNAPERSPSSPRLGPSGLPSVEPESFHPPMYSILIVCPQENTRRTTQDHIQQILPKSIPAQITSSNDVVASQQMITGVDPITFTHVVLVLRESDEAIAFMDQILNSISHPHTCVVIVTDQAQKQQILSGAPDFDYNQLEIDRRVRFLLKPAKPPKFALIFDPRGENALSKDQSKATAREAIDVQRIAFTTFKEVLGHRGIRVLAVEDNSVNMQMLTHFLGKICFLDVEKAWDGQQCLDKVFSQEPLHYKVIICDIQMPIKDGYVTCREIRKWEEDNKYPSVPIIALSANIMSEGRRDSAAAGFTNYTTKPVDWKVLGDMIMDLVNPETPHMFLRDRPIEAGSTPPK